MPEFAILFVGERGVGKTSLIRKMKGIPFERRYYSTWGHEVHPICLKYHPNTFHCLVDTPGELNPTSFKNINIVVLVYDSTSRTSSRNVTKWYTEAKTMYPNAPIVLLANKCDLPQSDQNTEFAIKNSLQSFEVSAKTGEGMNTFEEYLCSLTCS